MKKVGAILLLVCFLMGCGSARLTNFEDYKQDLSIVAEQAMVYYEANRPKEGHLTLLFRDHLIWTDGSAESSIAKIAELDLDYLWVTSDYVIFWEDETKYYGILYSQSPKAVIRELKTWHKSLDHYKLDEHWYEIGALNAI